MEAVSELFDYRKEPPTSIFIAFSTGNPLRELMQSRNQGDIETFVDTSNDYAVRTKRDDRVRMEEYRRLDSETLQLLLEMPKMISALELIAQYTDSGWVTSAPFFEIVTMAKNALPSIDGTFARARLAERFRIADAAPVMLKALLEAKEELRLLHEDDRNKSFPDENVLDRIEEAIDLAHGTVAPTPIPATATLPRVRVNPSIIAQAEKETNPVRWMYLSFASEQDGFLGAAILQAYGPASAIERAYELGINPGGSVMKAEIPESELPDTRYRNRLLTKEELLAFWPDSVSLRDLTLQDGEALPEQVCEACNIRHNDDRAFDEAMVGDD